MAAALEELVLKFDIRPAAPISVALAARQRRQQFAHFLQCGQKSLLCLFVEVRSRLTPATALGVFLCSRLQFVADADEINNHTAGLVAEDAVYPCDGLHERVTLHWLVDVECV